MADKPHSLGADVSSIVDIIVDTAVRAEREACAKIAEDILRYTASQTVERDMAVKLGPRIAKAIRERDQ